MNFRTKWKFAKMSATQGGVTFVDMKECQQGNMLAGLDVFIYADNKTGFDEDVFQKIREEGATVTTNREKAAIFLNIVAVPNDINPQLREVDSSITKKLFFVCQEQKDLLLKKRGGKILNVVMMEGESKNEVKEAINAGISNMTRGLAIATAANNITANSIIVQKSKTSTKSLGEIAVFLLSDCANDILGQIITL